MSATYLPDLLFWEGELHSDLALRVANDGTIQDAVPAAQASGPQRLPGRALLPGLVNGHSHAFQRLIRGATEHIARGHERDDFWSWRELMYRAAERLRPEEVYVASRQAFVEMALAGTCAVGEFHYLHHQPDGTPYADPLELARQVIRAAQDVGIRICLLRVAYARSGHNLAENPRQRRFRDPTVDAYLSAVRALETAYRGAPGVTVGVAPHSVRAVPLAWLTELASARAHIVHMHVSEQPAEIEACLAETGRRPVQLLDEVGLLGPALTAVHAIHLAKDEMERLGATKTMVCACPTTEMNLGDGVIPADALVEKGVRLSLGSDSQAAIDLLGEARALEGHLRLVRQRRNVLDPRQGDPAGLAKRLFQMATEQGARSLGLPTGQLAPGAPADFFTVALTHPSLVGVAPEHLLPAIVFGADKAAIRDVAVQGRLVVQDGHHPLEETSGRDYAALTRRLFT